MRFTGFKDTINPAIVRKASNPIQQKLLKILNWTIDGIKELLDLRFNEAFSDRKNEFEDLLFTSNCEYVCEFLKKYIPGYNGEKPSQSKCGTEGCAYFIKDFVMKATFGKRESFIANVMKGQFDIVPVIDVDKDPQTGVNLILMKKLRTVGERDKELNGAGVVIREYFDEWNVAGWKSYNIEYYLSLETFQKNKIRNYAKYKNTCDQLFEIINKIYKSTGYILGSDVSPDNLGYTPNNKVQILDLGYPQRPGEELKFSP